MQSAFDREALVKGSAVAAVAAAGTAAYLVAQWWRTDVMGDGAQTERSLEERGRYDPTRLDSRAERLSREVQAALREDEVLAPSSVVVLPLRDGMVELVGAVPTEEDRRRALARANAVEGVHTVVSHVSVQALEEHLAETRERFRQGDPALTETHWTGMGVGMGARRQSLDTDPPRPDDHAKLLDRELTADKVADQEMEPMSGASTRHASSNWETPDANPMGEEME